MVGPDHIGRARANAATLEKELSWFGDVFQTRLALHLGTESAYSSIGELDPPELGSDESMFADFVRHYSMSAEERLLLLLSLTPHVRPEMLDVFFLCNAASGRGFTEFGGIRGKSHGGFLPTVETALFLLSEGRTERRFLVRNLFDRDHFFARHEILRVDSPQFGEPLTSGQLVLSDEIVDFLTVGAIRKPDFSREFPARLITTEMEWSDLVLSTNTLTQMREVIAWMEHEETLLNGWGLGRRLRPGYTCLFYGPSGTGKTLTATLLGKRVGRDVYRIDLSSVVSKYIGETEKNLERVFDRAENMNCILFFDEGDALFGKRTSVGDAHDRYANQEVSYLLQRIEDFPGVAILATNFRGNIDDAFMRRFQGVVHFPMPDESERLRLWTESFSVRSEIDDRLDLTDVAHRFEITGGGIVNVVRYASLMALNEGDDNNVIRRRDVIDGIRRELWKEGKTL